MNLKRIKRIYYSGDDLTVIIVLTILHAVIMTGVLFIQEVATHTWILSYILGALTIQFGYLYNKRKDEKRNN